MNHGSGVTMTTMPHMCDNKAFDMEQVCDDATAETTASSTTSSPPAKPQRSFRHKQEEHQETPAYLEGCDHIKEEERRVEDEDEGGRGDDGESQTETDEDKYREDRGEKDGRECREEKEWRQEEEAGEQENRSREGAEERSGSEEEVGSNKVKGRDDKSEGEEGLKEEKAGDAGEKKRKEDVCRDSELSSTEDEETGSEKQEDTVKSGIMEGGGGASSSPPRPTRRSRVIRLYQYNEDGQRYCHLPDPSPDEPAPPPRLKQRSLSLTRLNAIMAAASAGPLDRRETGEEEKKERPHFHMEI
ncbi:uncharacterized protein AKAME5_002698600 [Lates japonicus]|uniref:Uncharacterized protein n=1 Tax=Lates japonicus TaxID=270547 RepID=A0AAD3M294_LATJO|nr:uncharacterized protein AKAME5_002698600 [Lates japonicus]